jgi:glutamate racemase
LKTRPPKILVFDSGVGGLTIVKAITTRLPQCEIVYASDTAAFPYGSKNEDELISRVDKVLHQLQDYCQADIIVVACNTASTVALPKIRERFDLPIVGVVPAIKPAAQLSQSQVMGLLATEGTVKREYTKSLIEEFAGDCKVIAVGSNALVSMAENKLRDESISQQALVKIIQPFTENKNIDTVILACTHFPLLKPELKACLPEIQHWVDSGDAIARRVEYWLGECGLELPMEAFKQHRGLFTSPIETIDRLTPSLDKFGIQIIQSLKID